MNAEQRQTAAKLCTKPTDLSRRPAYSQRQTAADCRPADAGHWVTVSLSSITEIMKENYGGKLLLLFSLRPPAQSLQAKIY